MLLFVAREVDSLILYFSSDVDLSWPKFYTDLRSVFEIVVLMSDKYV